MRPVWSEWIGRRRLEIARLHIRGDVLDLGCGLGAAVSLLNPDQDHPGIEVHSLYFLLPAGQSGRIAFRALDLDRASIDLGWQSDTILMLAVIEHLRDPDRLLAQDGPLVKKGARSVLGTTTPGGHMTHRIGAHVGHLSKSAVQRRQWAFSRGALQMRLRKCGLAVERHTYFLTGGNQLFMCTASAAEEGAP